jgi:hypothetical protein
MTTADRKTVVPAQAGTPAMRAVSLRMRAMDSRLRGKDGFSVGGTVGEVMS